MPFPTPGERAERLRAYLARQQWGLRREWTQQQEDAWSVLSELDQALDLLQRKSPGEDVEIQGLLERHGRLQESTSLKVSCSVSELL